MDQAEPSPLPGQPGKPQRQDPGEEPQSERLTGGQIDHPVVAGYDGSESSRNALAYAAGVSRRLARPLLVVHVTLGVPRRSPGRWLLFTSPPPSTASR